MKPDTKFEWLENRNQTSDLAYFVIASLICIALLLVPYFTYNEPETACITTKLSLTKGEYMTICGEKV